MITFAAYGPFLKDGFLHHELGNNPRFIQPDKAEVIQKLIPVEVYELGDTDFENFKAAKMHNGYRLKKLKLQSGIMAYVLWHNPSAR